MSLATCLRRMDAYERLIRLDKPAGIWLLLWPTLWGFFLASRQYGFSLWVFWIFILGTILMRSAGCALNDFADRRFDGAVARTRQRPLATGEIRPLEALLVALVLTVAAFFLVLPLGRLTVLLSLPALLLAASYPYFKRFFAIPQAYLGVAFGFGIPMVFAAVQERVPALAWCLLLCNVLWTIAYDTAYAMVDREDDLKIGIRTSAITFGRHDVLAVALCHGLSIAGLLVIGVWQRYGASYFAGCLLAGGLAGLLVSRLKRREPAACFRVFLDNHWIGFIILVGIVGDYLIHRFAH